MAGIPNWSQHWPLKTIWSTTVNRFEFVNMCFALATTPAAWFPDAHWEKETRDGEQITPCRAQHMCMAKTLSKWKGCGVVNKQTRSVREKQPTQGSNCKHRIQHWRGPLRHQQGSVQTATGDNMSTSAPERSWEPRVAMTGLKDSTSVTRMCRGVLHGNCRLWVDTNLNLQSSRNMLRRKRLSRIPHNPHTTRARNSTRTYARFPNVAEATTHQLQHTKRLHGDTNRVGRSCKSNHMLSALMLWVLSDIMLILDDAARDLLHLRKITHVYLIVAIEPLRYALEKTFCHAAVEIEPILKLRLTTNSDCIAKLKTSTIALVTFIFKHPEIQLILNNSFKEWQTHLGLRKNPVLRTNSYPRLPSATEISANSITTHRHNSSLQTPFVQRIINLRQNHTRPRSNSARRCHTLWKNTETSNSHLVIRHVKQSFRVTSQWTRTEHPARSGTTMRPQANLLFSHVSL